MIVLDGYSAGRTDSRDMFNIFESNIHLAEKAFDDKWILLVSGVEKVERNRLLLHTGDSRMRFYARFTSGAGLEDVKGSVELLCFDPIYSERNDIRTITVSDCELIDNPLNPDD